MDRTQSEVTTPGQNELVSDDNEGIVRITGVSPADYLMPYSAD